MTERYQVIWTPTAEQDFVEILEYIAVDNLSAAKQVAERIRQKADRLHVCPEIGRIVPELQHVGAFWYRELLIKPWRLIYRIERRDVFVLAVLDGRRDLDSLLLERLIRE